MNTFQIRFNFADKFGNTHGRVWYFRARNKEHAEKKFIRSLNSQAKKTFRDVVIEEKNEP